MNIFGGFFHWRFTHEKTPQKDFYTSVWKITIFLNSKQKVLKKVLYTSVIRTLRSTELVLLYGKLYYHDHKVPKVFFGNCRSVVVEEKKIPKIVSKKVGIVYMEDYDQDPITLVFSLDKYYIYFSFG